MYIFVNDQLHAICAQMHTSRMPKYGYDPENASSDVGVAITQGTLYLSLL